MGSVLFKKKQKISFYCTNMHVLRIYFVILHTFFKVDMIWNHFNG